jgi:hypothetical protein
VEESCHRTSREAGSKGSKLPQGNGIHDLLPGELVNIEIGMQKITDPGVPFPQE